MRGICRAPFRSPPILPFIKGGIQKAASQRIDLADVGVGVELAAEARGVHMPDWPRASPRAENHSGPKDGKFQFANGAEMPLIAGAEREMILRGGGRDEGVRDAQA